MKRNFWKATSISLAALVAAVLVGFWGGFQYALFFIPVFQLSWLSFCVVRTVQLRRAGAHKPGALDCDRESYGFALGGAISSTAMLLVALILTQAV